MKDNNDQQHTFLKENGKIKWTKLISRTLIAVLFIFILFLLYDKLFKTNVRANDIATQLYNDLGFHGVALFVYLCDTFLVPLTPDVMFPLVASDWNPLQITLFMGTASFLGGLSGYWLGHLLDRIKIIDRLAQKIMGTHKVLIHKKGAWAVVLAALTPIPYSTICWTAGILKVDFKKVALASLVRFPRMLIYYYLFRAGTHLIAFL
ncbi:MAG: VTT domain-containing protein [Sphaerochaetaceae bacterium]|nr:VTT domain-containing protein [Sphaerochaetaceae bacterium]